ncbi:uncharacterized protein BO66DRAFT_65213 [Aspergillus aculeatinus CBS 121060]|uniref:Uncharacterized protein n=1 Tax=Aspergillus aculeatinus CBS 121060 TaxID=1448322 RepID=A0ACD1HMC7_9EURO|nr:hypothetical protein BO66DRAFT_65213 [Aspergillus aculeatinus CBS 121060]RAH74730.1 hypothetical protein BO66DRAFT_65213 [Aspergillus aculeatinus CBS 121060]
MIGIPGTEARRTVAPWHQGHVLAIFSLIKAVSLPTLRKKNRACNQGAAQAASWESVRIIVGRHGNGTLRAEPAPYGRPPCGLGPVGNWSLPSFCSAWWDSLRTFLIFPRSSQQSLFPFSMLACVSQEGELREHRFHSWDLRQLVGLRVAGCTQQAIHTLAIDMIECRFDESLPRRPASREGPAFMHPSTE